MARLALLAALLAAVLLAVGCGDGERPTDTTGPVAEGRLKAEVAGLSTQGWETDFSRHSVPYSEFSEGGPPRDGIPPIDDPKPVSIAAAEDDLAEREPVMVVEVGDEARAYPLAIMVWHEIVNDELGGRPIAVTYCPLCNSAIVFDRRLGERLLTLGTTGKLRRSDLVMWDRQTESWFQQFSGEAIVGKLLGERLTPIPSQTLSWADFKRTHPDGTVLSRDTGAKRDYGRNPYVGYDADPKEQPFLLEDDVDARLPPKERVLLVRATTDDAGAAGAAGGATGGEAAGGDAVVIPFTRLRRTPVVSGRLGEDEKGQPFVALWAPGVNSALGEEQIADGRDVGTAGAFEPRIDGKAVRLRPAGDGAGDDARGGAQRGRFRDTVSGSTFDVTGRALDGPLRGKRLRPLQTDQQLWFAVAAFVPDARVLP